MEIVNEIKSGYADNGRHGFKQKYTTDNLINYLKSFREKNGRNPKPRDFVHNPDYPHFTTFQIAFGSWNKALYEAGLEIETSYTKEEILNSIKMFVNENGRLPMQKDFVGNTKYPATATVRRMFDGSWNNALKSIGLGVNKGVYNKDEIINIIKSFIKKNNREPVAKDFISNSNSVYNIFSSIIKEFGSWDEAKRVSGINVINCNTKARDCELQVFNSFKESGAVDLAGENRQSSFDGLCPKGKLYNVKSSKLYNDKKSTTFWKYNITESQIKEVDYFFFGAYDVNHKELLFMWRVDRDFIRNRKYINIGNNYSYEHNIDNMRKYDITKSFNENIIEKKNEV